MRLFVCVLDPEGHGITEGTLRAYEWVPRTRGLEFVWQEFPHATVLTAWDDPYGDPLVAKAGGHIAVGAARLDNREDVERWAGARDRHLTDLELAMHMVVRYGTRNIPELLGDFAFIVWSSATRTAIAASDALGVKRVYYTQRDGLVAFASRAEALALQDRYNAQYLAEMLAQCPLSPGLTVYEGVQRLPGGTIGVFARGEVTLRRYWSPDELEPEPLQIKSEREAPAICRQLLCDSVRKRLSNNGDTWAQLSGGLDSSSIVSTTQWLAQQGAISRGLGGTVTFVDRQGTEADEREYSDAVVNQWQVRNVPIVDPPFWLEDQSAPPRLDQPLDSLAFYPRERRLCDAVRGSGGRVLLAGFGSDELFSGSTLFFADWLVQGRLWATVRELARWAAIGRVSFWQLAYGNAVQPLLPLCLRRPKSFEQGRLLPWISAAADRRYHLGKRVFGLAANAARSSRKYHNSVVTSVSGVISKLDPGGIGDRLDVRYPFLYRPLVEFALRLPPELCAQPQARKWVLREAMRGILPEIVRRRVGKGASTDVLIRSLKTQRGLLEPLVRRPILAELGVVDDVELRAAFDAAPYGPYAGGDIHADVQTTLMVEAWLQIRSGRWPQGPS